MQGNTLIFDNNVFIAMILSFKNLKIKIIFYFRVLFIWMFSAANVLHVDQQAAISPLCLLFFLQILPWICGSSVL